MSASSGSEQEAVTVAAGAERLSAVQTDGGGPGAGAEDGSLVPGKQREASGGGGLYSSAPLAAGDGDGGDGGGSSSAAATEKKPAFVGLGLCYALLSSVFFSVVSLLAKKVEGIHSIEISGFRCFFQGVIICPLIIYNEISFFGPKEQRCYLYLRGFLGASAMILLFYAIQHMPLADATVIAFSNSIFVGIFAWMFLKERCTIWQPIFTIFILIGVILIARPPFLFGSHIPGIEVNYTEHIKGTFAAFGSALCAAISMIVIRKMGKSVHCFISIWYFSVIGCIECVIVVSIIQEWRLPYCGKDRVFLLIIGLFGVVGQVLFTKALQIEKAGPAALMKTMEVVMAFILQYFFLNRSPTWLSLGGALCVIVGTCGIIFHKWYTRKESQQ
ncbi:solute carrier family 35 member G1 isoform X1 [Callorhinchus milii]|uniref:solute carrier family 35 member G1 isoform X1 n=1 Tax=Callorhinchus milii TaxID=7868 RepID=UPI001C3F8483|nr:solute carrier family 35 member G1 isoform X1 [Callorhinchus milii]